MAYTGSRGFGAYRQVVSFELCTITMTGPLSAALYHVIGLGLRSSTSVASTDQCM